MVRLVVGLFLMSTLPSLPAMAGGLITGAGLEPANQCRHVVHDYEAAVIDDRLPADPPSADDGEQTVDYIQPAQRLFYQEVPCHTEAGICGVIGLAHPAPDITWFTNRPVRGSGQVGLDAFLEFWAEDGDFHLDPPNAAVSWTDRRGRARNAVVVLLRPSLEAGGTCLTYEVKTISGDLPEGRLRARRHPVLFIDSAEMDEPPHNLYIDGLPFINVSSCVGNDEDELCYWCPWEGPFPDSCMNASGEACSENGMVRACYGEISRSFFEDLTGTGPADNSFKIIEATNSSLDILLTTKATTSDTNLNGTTNSDSDNIGLNDQWIDPGNSDLEVLRIDFGQFSITPTDTFNIDSHSTVNGARFQLFETAGSAFNKMDVLVEAFDANDDNDLINDPSDPITRIIIYGPDFDSVLADVTGDTTVSGTDADGNPYSFTFTFDLTGVTITNLIEGYYVQTFTSDVYNRLEIDNVTDQVDANDQFTIGGISA